MSESVPCAFLVFSSPKKNNRGVEGRGAKRGSTLVSRATLCFEGVQTHKVARETRRQPTDDPATLSAA